MAVHDVLIYIEICIGRGHRLVFLKNRHCRGRSPRRPVIRNITSTFFVGAHIVRPQTYTSQPDTGEQCSPLQMEILFYISAPVSERVKCCSVTLQIPIYLFNHYSTDTVFFQYKKGGRSRPPIQIFINQLLQIH